MKAVLNAARGGLGGRRLQAVVIGLVVLAATAASVLALGMLVDARSPFSHSFAAQNGAHVSADVSTSRATAAQLAATRHAAGVIAVAGPFPETTVTAQVLIPGISGTNDTQVQVVGRAAPGGPVDDLTLTSGHWPRAGDQILWSHQGGLSAIIELGAKVTVPGVPGTLTVVGIATSITNSAQAWVLPGEISVLSGGSPGEAQLLYRFASAGSAAAVRSDIAAVRAAVRAALPSGALLSTESYLSVQAAEQSNVAVWVPFIVAFGVIALVTSVLIVINVVSGAVVAGTTRIGVLKSLGFTPAQVVGSYLLQVIVPALAGCVAGAVCGNLLAVPFLARNATVYQVGSLTMPVWVDVTVPLVVLALTAAAALLPALRAGRMSAVQAIATGRAPRVRRGYRAHRILGRWRFAPRAVTIGLAAPFSRPARTAVTAAAIVFGAIAVTFGAGLATSLDRADHDIRHIPAASVHVIATVRTQVPGHLRFGPGMVWTAAQRAQIAATLRADPGTLHYVPQTEAALSEPGVSSPVQVTAYDGDASWTGFALTSGRWYSGADEIDANTYFLSATGTTVGSSYTLSSGGHRVTVRIAGEVFDPGKNPDVYMGSATLAAVDPGLGPTSYVVGVRSGVNPQSYANRVATDLRGTASAFAVTSDGGEFVAVITLVTLLTMLLIAVAGLGVLNTVVLQLRERVHDLGVFKSVGMTPRQTIAMVMCTVAAVGLFAGIVAVPAGIYLHHLVVPVMGHAANSDLPRSLISVYAGWEVVALTLAGLVIALIGAVGPAGWAARARTAFALRAE